MNQDPTKSFFDFSKVHNPTMETNDAILGTNQEGNLSLRIERYLNGWRPFIKITGWQTGNREASYVLHDYQASDADMNAFIGLSTKAFDKDFDAHHGPRREVERLVKDMGLWAAKWPAA